MLGLGLGLCRGNLGDISIILTGCGGGTFAVVLAVAFSDTYIGTCIGKGTGIGIRTWFSLLSGLSETLGAVIFGCLVVGGVKMMIAKAIAHVEVRSAVSEQIVGMRMWLLRVVVMIDSNKHHA